MWQYYCCFDHYFGGGRNASEALWVAAAVGTFSATVGSSVRGKKIQKNWSATTTHTLLPDNARMYTNSPSGDEIRPAPHRPLHARRIHPGSGDCQSESQSRSLVHSGAGSYLALFLVFLELVVYQRTHSAWILQNVPREI